MTLENLEITFNGSDLRVATNQTSTKGAGDI